MTDYKITFIDEDGSEHVVEATEGESLMEAARDSGVDIEGTCDGSMACATCHVVVDPAWFAKLPGATDEEMGMLDFAYGVKDTSRLSCQITVTKDLDGMTVRLPEM